MLIVVYCSWVSKALIPEVTIQVNSAIFILTIANIITKDMPLH